MHRYIYLVYYKGKIVGHAWLKKDIDEWIEKEKKKGISKGIKIKKILFSKWITEKDNLK